MCPESFLILYKRFYDIRYIIVYGEDYYGRESNNHTVGGVCSGLSLIHIYVYKRQDSDNAMLEGIPTCKDLGYEGCVTDTSFGYYYKKDVPANVIEAFDNAVAAALENPECIKAFELSLIHIFPSHPSLR